MKIELAQPKAFQDGFLQILRLLNFLPGDRQFYGLEESFDMALFLWLKLYVLYDGQRPGNYFGVYHFRKIVLFKRDKKLVEIKRVYLGLLIRKLGVRVSSLRPPEHE